MDALRPLLAASPRALLSRMGLDQHALYVASLLMAATGRPLDVLYSRLGGITGPFFSHGWGDLNIVKLEEDLSLISTWPPADMKFDLKLLEEGSRDGTPFKRYEAAFKTPCIGRIWDALPPESRTARFQLLVPAHQQRAKEMAGVVHLAATGDQGFDRRLRLGTPLIQQGIASLILESPYYGARRPPEQSSCKLRYVSDLLALGWATIYESLHLLHWMEQEGYGRRGVAGLSMGGVHACMTAGLYPRDAACTPLLAPRSAAVAYCDGAMQPVTAWQPLLDAAADTTIPDLVARAAQAVHVMREASKALELLEQERMLEQQRAAGNGSNASNSSNASRSNSNSSSSSVSGSSSINGSDSNSSDDSAGCEGSSHESVAGTDNSSRVTDDRQVAAQPQGSAEQFEQLQATATASSSNLLQQLQSLLSAVASTAGRETTAAAPVDSNASNTTTTTHGGAHARGNNQTAHSHAAASASDASATEEEEQALLAAMLLQRRKTSGEQERAFRRLKQVLEIYTDVTRYPRPQRPDAAVLVAASHDAYVSVESVKEVHRYWEGSELRLLDGGHVSAFLLHQQEFRQAILDSLARL